MSRRTLSTFTGRAIDPSHITSADIVLEDVAHGLANENRYGGHTKQPYSVAQHSVVVAQIVSDILDGRHPKTLYPWDSHSLESLTRLEKLSLIIAGLFHDGHEFILKDIPTPIKVLLQGYDFLATECDEAIARHIGIDRSLFTHPLVEFADRIALLTEMRDIRPNTPFLPRDGDPPLRVERIHPWPWHEAKQIFLATADHLLLELKSIDDFGVRRA